MVRQWNKERFEVFVEGITKGRSKEVAVSPDGIDSEAGTEGIALN